jgi:hypothetical protein
MRKLLNPFKYGLYAIQLISHKVLRYLMPILLIMLFLSSMLILDRGLGYQLFFGIQVVFYVSAIVGGMPRYFCAMNLALLVALANFLRGEKNVLWKPVRK